MLMNLENGQNMNSIEHHEFQKVQQVLTNLSKVNPDSMTMKKMNQIRPQTAKPEERSILTQASKHQIKPVLYDKPRILNQYSNLKSLRQPVALKKTVTGKKVKKTDPVSLYQNMQKDWNKQKLKQKQRATEKKVELPVRSTLVIEQPAQSLALAKVDSGNKKPLSRASRMV